MIYHRVVEARRNLRKLNLLLTAWSAMRLDQVAQDFIHLGLEKLEE